MSNLNILTFPQTLYISGNKICLITFTATDLLAAPNVQQVVQIQPGLADPVASPYPTFPGIKQAIEYYEPSAAASLISTANTLAGLGTYSTYTASQMPSAVVDELSNLSPVAYSGLSSDISDFESATNALITTAVNDMIDGAPGALDTLKELADAINDDASYAATVTTSLGNKVDKASGFGLSRSLKLNSGSAPTVRSAPIAVTGQGTVSGGLIVFQLTDDGTAGGAALLPNGVDFMAASASSDTEQYGYSFTLSNSNKTLTVGVSAIASAMGVLGMASAANGVDVNILVVGS